MEFPNRYVRAASDIWNAIYLYLQVLAQDHVSRISLIPGTYTSSRFFLTSSLSLTSSINESISFSGDTLVVSPPTLPIAFDLIDYDGEGSISTSSSWKIEGWRSIYMPEGWYGTFSSGQTLWGTVPDSRQLPSTLVGPSIVKVASCMSWPGYILKALKQADDSRLQSAMCFKRNMHGFSVQRFQSYLRV